MRALLGAVAVLAGTAAPAAAQDADFLGNHLNAKGRAADQLSNPDYRARKRDALTDAGLDWVTDPYRLGWACPAGEPEPHASCRGRGEDVFFANRYEARLHGRLFAPKTGKGPFPAVVFGTGSPSPERPYWSLAQGLAEAGYVVLTVESQGEGLSQAEPPDPDPSTPANEYCRPGNWGDWQNRRSLGITETGPCAGQDPAMEGDTFGLAGPISFVEELATERADPEFLEALYDSLRARETFAIADAATFLLSDANPLRDLVDERRLGAVGHSGGGHGALWAGQADPRFDVVVTFDQHGQLDPLDPWVPDPRVPTMLQHADAEEVGPKRGGHDPDSLAGVQVLDQFRNADVDAMLVTLAGSTHQEWNYIPYLEAAVRIPGCVFFCYSSALGERVALHYAQAWLDRWLKPKKRVSSRERLLARRFDGSADASSIGQGTFDAALGRNVPYTIGGRRVSQHLSRYFRSAAAFDGIDCRDLRRGC